jgi:hypothetical protein
MTSAALVGAFFKAALAGRNPAKSHPVLAGGTHRPLGI